MLIANITGNSLDLIFFILKQCFKQISKEKSKTLKIVIVSKGQFSTKLDTKMIFRVR